MDVAQKSQQANKLIGKRIFRFYNKRKKTILEFFF